MLSERELKAATPNGLAQLASSERRRDPDRRQQPDRRHEPRFGEQSQRRREDDRRFRL